jgi:hypothetical protein
LHSRHFFVKVETEYTELSAVNVDVLQGNVLGPSLYLLYTADLPTSPESITTTFADDTAVLATDSDSAIVSHNIHISKVQLPEEEDIKCLGLHLDRRLAWHKKTFLQNGNN